MAKGKVEIRAESCKSCGYCVKFCPKKVLAIGEKVNSKGYQFVVAANPDDCIGCAAAVLYVLTQQSKFIGRFRKRQEYL